jgi:hypothetical protein
MGKSLIDGCSLNGEVDDVFEQVIGIQRVFKNELRE